MNSLCYYIIKKNHERAIITMNWFLNDNNIQNALDIIQQDGNEGRDPDIPVDTAPPSFLLPDEVPLQFATAAEFYGGRPHDLHSDVGVDDPLFMHMIYNLPVNPDTGIRTLTIGVLPRGPVDESLGMDLMFSDFWDTETGNSNKLAGFTDSEIAVMDEQFAIYELLGIDVEVIELDPSDPEAYAEQLSHTQIVVGGITADADIESPPLGSATFPAGGGFPQYMLINVGAYSIDTPDPALRGVEDFVATLLHESGHSFGIYHNFTQDYIATDSEGRPTLLSEPAYTYMTSLDVDFYYPQISDQFPGMGPADVGNLLYMYRYIQESSIDGIRPVDLFETSNGQDNTHLLSSDESVIIDSFGAIPQIIIDTGGFDEVFGDDGDNLIIVGQPGESNLSALNPDMVANTSSLIIYGNVEIIHGGPGIDFIVTNAYTQSVSGDQDLDVVVVSETPETDLTIDTSEIIILDFDYTDINIIVAEDSSLRFELINGQCITVNIDDISDLSGTIDIYSYDINTNSTVQFDLTKMDFVAPDELTDIPDAEATGEDVGHRYAISDATDVTAGQSVYPTETPRIRNTSTQFIE